jgi:hypothetical protein
MQTEYVSKRAEKKARYNLTEYATVHVYAIKDGSTPKNGIYDRASLKEIEKELKYLSWGAQPSGSSRSQ